jgi:hypothetical protein
MKNIFEIRINPKGEGMSKEKCKRCSRETEDRDHNGNPECSYCRRDREDEYDNFVDPLGFYRSKSIDNYD